MLFRSISVDFRTEVNPTVVHNLSSYPWPFSSNSFDVIYASHVMEHMDDNVIFMEELYRISKPMGKVIIRVPHFSGRSAWCDPTHKRAYSYHQFFYYDKKYRDHYGKCDFKLLQFELHYIRFDFYRSIPARMVNRVVNFCANLNPNLCEKVWCYWVGGFSEVYVELKTIK